MWELLSMLWGVGVIFGGVAHEFVLPNVKTPSPPALVASTAGFQWHAEQSKIQRKAFFEKHTKIDGKWMEK